MGSIDSATAAESKLKGNMFGDYYYAVSGPMKSAMPSRSAVST